MDIFDFSGGINTDVDAQDQYRSKPETMRTCVNFDIRPGYLEKRDGTAEKTWQISDDGGTIPLPDEEIVQIVEVHAPLAIAGSVEGFNSHFAVERCFNQDVTIILTRLASGNYRLYYNGVTNNGGVWEFDPVNTPDGTAELLPADWSDDRAFMIPRTGGVAIGNVKTYDSSGNPDEDGVLWFGHIKRLAGWHRGASTTYSYMSHVDEWRLSNAECYDSRGEIGVTARVLSYENLYTGMRSPTHPLYNKYPVPGSSPTLYYEPEEVLERGLAPFLLGALFREFEVKVTAEYDGFQESRPLVWEDVPILASAQDPVTGARYAEAALPDGWRIEVDRKTRQTLKMSIEEGTPRTILKFGTESDPYAYPRIAIPGSSVPTGGLTMQMDLVWKQVWRADQPQDASGEGFYILLQWRRKSAPVTDIYYRWLWNGPVREGLSLEVTGPDATRMFSPIFLRFLLGADPPSRGEIDTFLATATGTEAEYDYYYFLDRYREDVMAMEGWNACRSLWTVGEATYGTDTALYAGDPDPYHPIHDPWVRSSIQGTFWLYTRPGIGMLAIEPYLPATYITAAADATNTRLGAGGRRLSAFKIYVKEKDVDIDFTLRQRIALDHNPADPDRGGTEEEPEDQLIGYRSMGLTGNAPVWMVENLMFRPYYETSPAVGDVRAGIPQAFIISDNTLKDRVGTQTLAGNMQRDETERDRPRWIRGAMFGGRLMGVAAGENNVQYCIFAGGVPQYDIMPDVFHVAPGERVTHLVVFRKHYMIFTDENLWRIDLADGDIFNWRVMDTFTHRGTVCWQAIVPTPLGLVFPNREGIWLYDGNYPKPLIEDVRLKEYQADYADDLSAGATYGAYHGGEDEVHLALATDERSQVWVYDTWRKAWRDYVYLGATGNAAPPHYMLWHNGEFIRVFDVGDARITTDLQTDLGLPYSCIAEGYELPPASQIDLPFFQYMGAQFLSPEDYPARLWVTYRPYKHGIHPNLRILMPGVRDEYFFPLPMGITRGLRWHYGQGTYVGDLTNSDENVRLHMVSVRGSGRPQWEGTR
jgi:hypothetical protein